ncbi:MAG: glycoside hydrolase family 127 protein [Ruminococcaceae bacterium]|nr:glycoside hydrolase family 127 protein [Oscillospiraceae bacterium]
MKKESFSKHIDLKNIKINDPFWNKIIELVRTDVIPYQYEAFNDRIEGAEKSYCFSNFRKAAKAAEVLREGKKLPDYPVDKWQYTDDNCDENSFHGWVFQDSDFYKWIEAVGYSLSNHPDEQLKRKAEEVIDLICSAQLENGYINTYYTINNPEKAFTNIRDFHELYCFGHLSEGAIAYYNATGNRKLLDATCRYADLICETFGRGEGQKKAYPGHEIAEMALVKLYEATGEKKYLDEAKFFIDERGLKPCWFDVERNQKTRDGDHTYEQAHLPVREQKEAVGHAVRAVYLYSGMADIAKYYCDDTLLDACESLWNNIENQKLYITGGIGATVDGEAFSFDYDLPNDQAYAETCASIGLVFFARRMAEVYPDSRYHNVAERALFNNILSGMAEDGKSFFYSNLLEVNPEACKKDSRKRYISPVRQKWFGCACCPPNLARMISSLGEYCFAQNDETIFIHQYVGAEIKADNADIRVNSTYAENGRVQVSISPKKPIKLAVRIPEWCRDFEISAPYEIKNGYAYISITEKAEIFLDFKSKAKLIKCSNLVRENAGKAALSKGPFVYCIEEVDNGKNLQMLRVNPQGSFTDDGEAILADGFREKADTSLYSEYKSPEESPAKIRFIPYYKWANRGENEMTVYFRV